MIKEISIIGLLLSYILIIGILFVNYREKLKLTKTILMSFGRMSIQLFLSGFVLLYIFKINTLIVVTCIFIVMVAFATRIVISTSKVKFEKMYLYVFIAMLLPSICILFFLLIFIIGLKPFYEAQYAIPLGGMLIGNSMSAITIAVERFYTQFMENIKLVEEMLSLGATSNEAVRSIRNHSIRSALIPSLASASSMGVVFLPGMMTGQIISGVDPIHAVVYQIVIVIAIDAALSLAVYAACLLENKSFFNEYVQINSV